jgi:hypothetical protein
MVRLFACSLRRIYEQGPRPVRGSAMRNMKSMPVRRVLFLLYLFFLVFIFPFYFDSILAVVSEQVLFGGLWLECFLCLCRIHVLAS